MKLKANRLKCNIEMFFFGQTKMEYLGFLVIQTGTRPVNKKIEAIVNMKPPINKKTGLFVHRLSKII